MSDPGLTGIPSRGGPFSAGQAIAEWRVFMEPRYRRFQGISGSGAVVAALVGDGLTIPLLLELGASPALATVIGVLPFAFSAAQLGVPWLLRRSDGNLRGVTLVILALGETRGFILGGLTLAAWIGLIPSGVAILAIGAVMSLGGAATTIGGTNLLAWYGAIMPDNDRRFVAPRVMGLTLGLGAVLLLPVALIVQVLEPTLGVRIYAVVFLVSGIAGVVEILILRRLTKPGRVRVARHAIAGRPSGDPALAPPPAIPALDLGGCLRGRLRAVPVDLRDQRPRPAAQLRDPALGDLVGSLARGGHGRGRAAGQGQRLAHVTSVVPDARLVDAPGPDRVPGQSAGWPGHLRRGRAGRGRRLGRHAVVERAVDPPLARSEPDRRAGPVSWPGPPSG